MAFRDLFDNDRRSKDDLRQEIEIRDRQFAALKTAEVSAKEIAKQLRIDLEKLEKLLLESQATNRELKEQIERHDAETDKLRTDHRNEVIALRKFQESELANLRVTRMSPVTELSQKIEILEDEKLKLNALLKEQQNSDMTAALAEIMILRSEFQEISRQKIDEMESNAASQEQLRFKLEKAVEELNLLKSKFKMQENVNERDQINAEVGTVKSNKQVETKSWQASNVEHLAKQEMWIALQRHSIFNVKQLDERLDRYQSVDVSVKNAKHTKQIDAAQVLIAKSEDMLAFYKSQLQAEKVNRAAEVAKLRMDLTKNNETANKRIKDLEDENIQLKDRNGALFITNIAIDNENKAFRAKADQHIDQTHQFNDPNSNIPEKLTSLRSKESECNATDDRQVEMLDNVNRDLRKELERLRAESVDREVFVNAQKESQLKLDRERQNYKALVKRSDDLSRQVQHIQDQFSQQTSRFQSEKEDLRKSLVATRTSLTHPVVLRWLLAESSPHNSSVPKGAYAISGELPWGIATLIRELAHKGFVKRDLFDKSVDFVVLGKQGWLEKDLVHKISSSDRTFLRFYSQEMFVAKLVTTRDPFDTEDSELLEAFAADHPALQFLMSYNQSWPSPVHHDGDDEGSWDGDWSEFGVSESPLHLAGYQVGVTSKLSVYDRRQILRGCYLNELKFAHDSTADYQKQWGKSGTPKRLFRIAQHLKQLADGQGRDRRKSEAQKDWISDLEWLRKEIYIKSGSKFKWP